MIGPRRAPCRWRGSLLSCTMPDMNGSDSIPPNATRRNPQDSRRSFNLADGLILIAATAVAFGLIRGMAHVFEDVVLWRPRIDAKSFGQITEIVGLCLLLIGSPCLAAWTPAVLLLRLRHPRPNRRKLLMQPGTMACLTGTCALGLALVVAVTTWVISCLARGSMREVSAPFVLLYTAIEVGTATLWAWITLALLGRWRPEPTWLDRFGRFIGISWILIAGVAAFILVGEW